jgi:hypothetical protein
MWTAWSTWSTCPNRNPGDGDGGTLAQPIVDAQNLRAALNSHLGQTAAPAHGVNKALLTETMVCANGAEHRVLIDSGASADVASADWSKIKIYDLVLLGII